MNPWCTKCEEESVENMANWKKFYFCRECREEVKLEGLDCVFYFYNNTTGSGTL
jgi:hypothetical protein